MFRWNLAPEVLYIKPLQSLCGGIGHFEPLRHYAENLHLLLEPLERGKGLQFASSCSEDVLDKNWQRLVLTHLAEKKRSQETFLRERTLQIYEDYALTAGRAHIKHTEGGDFRQATYRAVRRGLRIHRFRKIAFFAFFACFGSSMPVLSTFHMFDVCSALCRISALCLICCCVFLSRSR